MLIHAAWNLQRYRTLEAQLMANGIKSLLDERTAKALERLQRYAASAQRSYTSALKELRTVQNNRLVRRTLEGDTDDELPELVSVGELTKRTQQIETGAERADLLAIEAFVAALSRLAAKRSHREPRSAPPHRGPNCRFTTRQP